VVDLSVALLYCSLILSLISAYQGLLRVGLTILHVRRRFPTIDRIDYESVTRWSGELLTVYFPQLQYFLSCQVARILQI